MLPTAPIQHAPIATTLPVPTPSWSERALAVALGGGFDQLVRRGLRGVWVRGGVPPGPVVLAANHHSWWDAFVLLAVLRHERRAPALVMAGENLSAFRYLRALGVVSQQEVRAALTAVRCGRALIVFPEGELRTAGPLGSLAGGASWFARKAPATLVVAAVRVHMRGHQRPEAYVDLQPASADLPEALAQALASLDDGLRTSPPEEPPCGFRQVVPGRRDWDERLRALSRRS